MFHEGETIGQSNKEVNHFALYIFLTIKLRFTRVHKKFASPKFAYLKWNVMEIRKENEER